MKVDHEGTIHAAPADVYAAIADIGHRPKWLTELDRVEAPPGTARPGIRFTGETRIYGHRFLGVSEVIVAENASQLTEEVYLGAHFRSTWTIEPAADGARTGTRLHHRLDLDFPAGLLGPLARFLLRRRLRRMSRASFRALDTLLRSNE